MIIGYFGATNTYMDRERLTVILAFLAIYLIWGSTYLFNKILVTDIPPFQLSGIRFIIAGLIILVIAIARRSSLQITKLQLKNTLLAGFLFLTIGNGCVVWALKYINSGFAALLISTQPLILLIMLRVLQNQKIVLKSVIGTVLGICGIALLTYAQGLQADISWKGIGLVMISLLCWGYGSIFVGSASLPKNQFVNSAYQMILGGIMMMMISLLIQEPMADVQNLDAQAVWSLAYLIVFGSIIAFTSFNYLLQKVSPEKVATSTYINPIVALILGYVVLNETIGAIGILASAILLAGVYFINSARPKKSMRSKAT